MAIKEKVILEGEDRASQAFKQAGGSFESMAKKFAAATGLAIGAQQLLHAGVAAIKLASDANEAASAFATTFGPATGKAAEFVEEFALKAGFATHELQQMLAITGNVVQGIGATEQESAALAQSMATLAGDVASFSNAAGGAQAVMAALQSAINGEREALKTYGLALSEAEVQQKAFDQTGKTSADTLTRLERANATVALAYEKAGKAVGDLDRTQDSAANTFRRMQATIKEAGVRIGQTLLPAALKVVLAFEDMAPALEDVAGQVASLAADLAPLVTLLGKATSAGFGWMGWLEDSSESSNIFRQALGGVTDVFERTLNPIEAFNDASAQVRDTWAQAQQIFGPAGDDILLVGRQLGSVESKLQAHRIAAGHVVNTYRDAHDVTRAATGAWRNAAPAVNDMTLRLTLFADETVRLNDALRAATDPLFAATDAWITYTDMLKEAKDDGEQTAEETLAQWEALIRLNAALDALDGLNYLKAMDAIRLSTGASREEIEAVFALLESFDGRTFRTSIDIDVPRIRNEREDNPPPAPTPTPLPADAFAHGGKVPYPAGAPVVALVHGQEQIATPGTFDEMVALLGDIRSRSGGAGITIDQLIVQVSGQADGHQIGREIEAYLASSQLQRLLPERL